MKHKAGCKFLRAATCAIGIECDHGRDVCPICDPCECGIDLIATGQVGAHHFVTLDNLRMWAISNHERQEYKEIEVDKTGVILAYTKMRQ